MVELWTRTAAGPVPTGLAPTKVACVLKNYAAHNAEMTRHFSSSAETNPHFFQAPSDPLFFVKPPSALAGPGEPIRLPRLAKSFHHEVELGVVIGTRLKHATREDAGAPGAIFGYVVVLDITARDLQEHAMKNGLPWTIAKGFDTFAPVSHVTPAEHVRDPHRLRISLRVNGEVRQDASTDGMIFDIYDQIAYISSVMALEPGDIVATGTPDGVGPIVAGDRLDAEIEEVGTLSVVVEADSAGVPR